MTAPLFDRTAGDHRTAPHADLPPCVVCGLPGGNGMGRRAFCSAHTPDEFWAEAGRRPGEVRAEREARARGRAA